MTLKNFSHDDSLVPSPQSLVPELLAPAGNFDALKAAVEAGANAVYLAGEKFGARAYAENFAGDNLAEAVKFAHLRGVAVHVTVNTIVATVGACMLMVRRLHDLDKSGIRFLISFIPVVGLIFMAYLFFAEGTVGWNKFGPDPLIS